MKKFKFRLQTLKRHKEAIEREKQGQLSKMMKNLKDVEAELNELDESAVNIRKQASKISNNLKGEVHSATQYWVIDNYLKGLKVKREEVKIRLQEKEKEAEEAYREFVNARKEVKVLSTLKDKQLADHKERERKIENRRLDDIYIMRDRLKSKENGSD